VKKTPASNIQTKATSISHSLLVMHAVKWLKGPKRCVAALAETSRGRKHHRKARLDPSLNEGGCAANRIEGRTT
jgi:hypothetical protein